MLQTNRPSSAPRATIKTVAQHAGVSVAAVSKVLRNAYGVSDGMRRKVEASIRLLGYRPNVAARAMRGQTMTVGVLLVDISNPFFPQIIDGMNEVLDISGYRAMIGVGQSKSKLEVSLLESMISYQMDGLILVAPQIHGDALARFAKQVPMVVVGHHEATATTFDTVNSDDREGAAIAVHYFQSFGMSDIAMLGLEMDDPGQHNVETQREIGFTSAIQRSGLGKIARILRIRRDPQNRLPEITALLREPGRPRALFCWSDLDAVHVLDAANRLGLRVPEDLAVIGYDNSSVADMSVVDLASIDQSGHRIGSLAAETLLSRMNGRRVASHLLIEPTFVRRGSLGG